MSGGDNSAADQAQQQEQQRQSAIKSGTASINGIFDGTTKTVGKGLVDPNDYTRGSSYYTADGTPFTYNPMTVNPSTLANDPEQVGFVQTYNNQNPTPSALYSGTDTVKTPGTFTPEFYQKQYQNYLDYETPQLNDQYANEQKKLTYALANSGNLSSSARAQQEGNLAKLYGQGLTKVTNDALGYENSAKANVETARTNLINTLTATGDATQAANSANSQASILSQPASYSALGDMFSSFTNDLSAGANAYSNAALLSKYGLGSSAGGVTNFSNAGAVKNN